MFPQDNIFGLIKIITRQFFQLSEDLEFLDLDWSPALFFIVFFLKDRKYFIC